ncbi:MAG: tail fiber protein [Chloroflexi bacterium]|nr:tail fiber protein [Chloroflexota bacterium]
MRRISLFLLALLFVLPAVANAQEYRGLLPVGSVQAYAGITPPSGWLVADGSCISRTAYARLYGAIGTVYGTCGGDPNLFALPDLRGRTVIGAGAGNGLTNRVQGTMLGEETHLLTIPEMPVHDHNRNTYGYTEWVLRSNTGGNAYFVAGSQVQLRDATKTGTAGGGTPHNIMQPSTVLTYIIWAGTEELQIVAVLPTATYTPTPENSPTPTVSPTPTATPTTTPNIYAVWTLAPESTDEPGQAVAFAYEMSAGGTINAVLLFAILVSILVMVTLAMLRRKAAG